jgi:hypothetical protein
MKYRIQEHYKQTDEIPITGALKQTDEIQNTGTLQTNK